MLLLLSSALSKRPAYLKSARPATNAINYKSLQSAGIQLLSEGALEEFNYLKCQRKYIELKEVRCKLVKIEGMKLIKFSINFRLLREKDNTIIVSYSVHDTF